MVTLRRRLRIAVLGIKQLPATGGADRAVEKLLEHGSQSHEYFVYVKRQPAQPSLGGQNVHYVPIPTVGGKHAGPFVYFLLCTAHYLVRGHYDLAPLRRKHIEIAVKQSNMRPVIVNDAAVRP